jgi:hypothetical protein
LDSLLFDPLSRRLLPEAVFVVVVVTTLTGRKGPGLFTILDGGGGPVGGIAFSSDGPVALAEGTPVWLSFPEIEDNKFR